MSTTGTTDTNVSGEGPLKYYAIRIGSHIEFRSSRQKPRAVTSTLTKLTKKKGVEWETMAVIDIPVKAVQKQTCYIGGRVLGVTTFLAFYETTCMNLGRDVMIEVDRKLYRRCMKNGRLL